MPVLQRFGAISIRLYAGDHRPPHFYIVAPDFQVLVRIADLATIAGQAPPRRIATALRWAAANRDELERLWDELNERR
ncbi:MAG TPA: DUF4160 domain-containing protein [Acetobacteraceae bacterium]|nr:DUF4160 domain-containing protein [Acetobacteraceae bacterium]